MLYVEGNPHRILSPQRANPNYLKSLYLSSSYVLSILAGVGWNRVVLGCRGYKMVTVTTGVVDLVGQEHFILVLHCIEVCQCSPALRCPQ